MPNFACVRDTRLVLGASGGAGNGSGVLLSVGAVEMAGGGTARTRSVMSFDCTFVAGQPVTDAALSIVVTSGCSGSMGSAQRFFAEEVLDGWVEGTFAERCNWHTLNRASTADAVGEVWPGPDASTARRGQYSGSPGEGVRISTDITALAEALRVRLAGEGKTQGALRLRVIAANATLTTYEETNRARYTSFHSRHAANTSLRPRVEVTQSSDRPPNVPRDVRPVTNADGTPALVTSPDGTEVSVTSTYSHPTGRPIERVQHLIHAATATDANPGAVLRDANVARTATTATERITNLPTGRLRRRTRHFGGGLWGPFTPLAQGYIETATQPASVGNPRMSDLPDPLIFGTLISSRDYDWITAWHYIAHKDTPGGPVLYWDSGEQEIAGNSLQLAQPYRGVAVVAGDTIRWTLRLRNLDLVWTPYSPSQPKTFSEPTGPAGLFPKDTSVKLDSLTPTLTIADAAAFDQYRWYLYRFDQLRYDSGVVPVVPTSSVPVTVPPGILVSGDRPEWQAQVRRAGESEMRPLSPRLRIAINSAPRKPKVTVVDGIRRADGMWVVPTSSAAFTVIAPFGDPDEDIYPEAASQRRVEVRAAASTPGAGPHVAGSPNVSASRTETIYWAQGVSLEGEYDVQVTWADSAGVAASSDWVRVKPSRPPVTVITSQSAPAGAQRIVRDPTPVLRAQLSSPSGKSLVRSRWEIYRRIPT